MTLQSKLTTTVSKRLLVQHNYHDHSNDAPYYFTLGDYIGDPNAIFSDDCYEQHAAANGRTAFPMKLHELLVKTEEDGFTDIISWKPHGRAFVICNSKKFAEKVLPQYFGETKFLSFQRQLNLYDFARITEGPDLGAYYHEMFLRGKIFLADCITRRKVKGTKIKPSANPEKEPNFYEMSYVGVAVTALNAPVALQPFFEENAVLSSIILQRFDEQTLTFNDLESMSLLETASLELDEIDTTSLSYCGTTNERADSINGINAHDLYTTGPFCTVGRMERVHSFSETGAPPDDAVHSFTGLNVHEIDTERPSYSVGAKEGLFDWFTGTNDPPDDLEWTSLQELSLDLDKRNQFFCQQNSTEEEFGNHESEAKELNSVTDWVRDSLDEPYDNLIHTRNNRMAPCPQVQNRNDRPNIELFAISNTVWGSGEPWKSRLQPGQFILPGVEKLSAPMAREEYTNRQYNLVMRMEQSERSRLDVDQLLKTSSRRHSLHDDLHYSRSSLRQMIQDDCEVQCLLRLHGPDSSDNPQVPYHLQCWATDLEAHNDSQVKSTKRSRDDESRTKQKRRSSVYF